jgi:hypothetical protein
MVMWEFEEESLAEEITSQAPEPEPNPDPDPEPGPDPDPGE